jgi:hypothetical protein
MELPSPDQISVTASRLAFGEWIIQNNLRAPVVEVIVYYALRPDWRHCSGDRYGWDFEHKDVTRLEVKQSALRQTWAASESKSTSRFDIKERAGYWENGGIWIAQPGRSAHIYVFAYHGISDETVDHREPRQWQSYVVRTSRLPAARTIGLSAVAALSPALNWHALFEAVERERLLL